MIKKFNGDVVPISRGFLGILACSIIPPIASGENKHKLTSIGETTHESAQKQILNVTQKSLGAQVADIQSEAGGWYGNLENITERLLGEDAADSVVFPVGQSTLLIALNDESFLNRFSTYSFDASGSLKVRTRPDSSGEWETITDGLVFVEDSPIEINFPFTSARFVELTFLINTEGEIGKLALVGEDTVEQVSSRDVSEFDEQENELGANVRMVPFDYSSVPNGAKITHVSSGNPDEAYKMIDDDIATSYAFDPNDSEYVVIYDLNAEKTLNRISLVMEAGSGKVEVYALNTLPEEILDREDDGVAVGEIPMDGEFFDKIDPILDKQFEKGVRKLQVDFEGRQTRFVLVRWIKNPPPAAIVYSVSRPDSVQRIDYWKDSFPVDEGTRLIAGDNLSVGLNSLVYTGLPNNDSVKIGVDSTINFESSHYNAETGILRASIGMQTGLVVGKMDQLKKVPGSSYSVVTPAGTVEVTGTRFLVEYRVDPETGEATAIFAVTEGSINFEKGNAAFDIPGGIESIQAGEELVLSIAKASRPDAQPDISVTFRGNITPGAKQAIENAILFLSAEGFTFPPPDALLADATPFVLGEVSLMGSVPSDVGFFDYMPRSQFLQTTGFAGGTGAPGPTVTPVVPPEPLPDLDNISP